MIHLSYKYSALTSKIIGCDMKVLLEKVHYTQTINYLEEYHLEAGLLINFGAISMEHKRFEHKKYKNYVFH